MSKRRPKRTLDRKPTAAERKTFTAHKMALLDKAVLDADLTDFQQRLLAYIVNKYLWKPGDLAYPGADRLMVEFGASERAIWKALNRFESRGYLHCVMRGKRGRGKIVRTNTSLVLALIHKPTEADQTLMLIRPVSRNRSVMGTDLFLGAPQTCFQVQGRPLHSNSLEGTPLKEHTPSEGVCRKGKEEPTPDSRDDDAESMEYFRRLFDGPSHHDGSQPNGGGNGNGHGPTSPVTDLDHAVATYLAGLANHPKQASKQDIVEIRQLLAEILEKDPVDVVMAAMRYHQMDVWHRKDAKYRSSPVGFLKNGTWWKDTPPYILDAAREDHRRRQQEIVDLADIKSGPPSRRTGMK
jgi:hypothetical protein